MTRHEELRQVRVGSQADRLAGWQASRQPGRQYGGKENVYEFLENFQKFQSYELCIRQVSHLCIIL